MVDLSNTIIAKSDQLNSDDLMGGPITIRITRVAGMNDKEQPIAIHYEGDGGKPYKPGKSMRRVLVNFWGKDGEGYVGRSMTLFRDPNVEFGGIKVGGIRISHMSDLGNQTEMALAVTRGAKRRFAVKALRVENNAGSDGIEDARAAIADAADLAGLERVWRMKAMAAHRDALRETMEARKVELSDAGGTTDQHDDDDHPACKLADEAILKCQRAEMIGDVMAAETSFASHRAAAPDDIVAEVDRAIKSAKTRLKGGAA